MNQRIHQKFTIVTLNFFQKINFQRSVVNNANLHARNVKRLRTALSHVNSWTKPNGRAGCRHSQGRYLFGVFRLTPIRSCFTWCRCWQALDETAGWKDHATPLHETRGIYQVAQRRSACRDCAKSLPVEIHVWEHVCRRLGSAAGVEDR